MSEERKEGWMDGRKNGRKEHATPTLNSQRHNSQASHIEHARHTNKNEYTLAPPRTAWPQLMFPAVAYLVSYMVPNGGIKTGLETLKDQKFVWDFKREPL